MFRGDLVGDVSKEAREIMVVHLIGEGVFRGDEDVREQTGFCWRDICKPARRVLV